MLVLLSDPAPVLVLLALFGSVELQQGLTLILFLLTSLLRLTEPVILPVVMLASPVFSLALLLPVLAVTVIVLLTVVLLVVSTLVVLLVDTLALLVESAPVVLLVALSAKATGPVTKIVANDRLIRTDFPINLFVLTTPFYPVSEVFGQKRQ